MNIKEAKQEITNTLRAYLAKDELGNYLIPSIRQRPVLLMGPPGIGKTQIMEQIASETGVGLVSYTITHHTRQSAIGLPFIEKETFDGQEFSITEYTMSEILASVYRLMKKTGLKEGILFLDEINCVSETLAPMMLQFLQCKTFGNQRLPEGWLIVAAGNPPEYNKSVRDFDVVTLDRVKRIDVTEDFPVWKEYAYRHGLHGAVISYVDIKKENFYRIEATVDGLQFVTARGWEDLSELLQAYEKLGLRADRNVIGQYLQFPQVAKDFANYLDLYYKYQQTYHVEEILNGTYHNVTVLELRSAPFDEKLSVMGLLLSRLSEVSRKVRVQDELTDDLYAALKSFKTDIETMAPQDSLAELISLRYQNLERAKDAGQLDKTQRSRSLREIRVLERYLDELRQRDLTDAGEAMETIRGLFREEVERRRTVAEEATAMFDHSFHFLEETFEQSQELVIFVTEITAGYDTSWFVENFGCDAYFRHNRELLFDDTQRRIRDEIASAREKKDTEMEN